MLYQELPQIGSTPLDRWGRWLVPFVIAGAAVTAGVLLLLIGQFWFAAAAVFLSIVWLAALAVGVWSVLALLGGLGE